MLCVKAWSPKLDLLLSISLLFSLSVSQHDLHCSAMKMLFVSKHLQFHFHVPLYISPYKIIQRIEYSHRFAFQISVERTEADVRLIIAELPYWKQIHLLI